MRDVGLIVVLAIVAAGAAAMTWRHLKNTGGPKERAHVVVACVVTWVILISFVVLAWKLPSPWRFWIVLPYLVLSPALAVIFSTRRIKIRRLERMEEAARTGTPVTDGIGANGGAERP